MVVGNGDIGPNAREAIADAHAVVRFNDCRSAGADAARTDIVVVCNTGRPGKKMLGEPGWRAHPSVNAADEIWCVRDPEKFAEMRAPLAVSHPELDDFCDDYTDGFRAYAGSAGKGFRVVPRAVHERLDEALSAFSPAPYVVPSTGLVTIADLIENRMEGDDHIALAGFSHQGWDGHPWDAERDYLEPLEAKGLVRRITETKHA
ncbi:Urease operon accessory protein [Rhizobium sp. C4]|uniref:Urease operon accessory protein n=1 Tax=Rhizobium sp. C4 TaxID=1349800 RepID=UPI001E61413C|nr:Urease operon accessory protein [Rhizobium sp. C4]MCD2173805.1 Urease operon accessory protein [Rhizobium sp. C4]